MTSDSADGLPGYAPVRSALVGRLAMARESSRVLFPVLSVELTTLVLAGLLVVRTGAPSRYQMLTALLLVVIGILHSEIARGIERVRRRITDGNKVDLSSVWTFAAALLLPPVYAGTVAVVVHGYLWVRSWRLRTPLYRHVFSTTTVVLACFAASATVDFAGTGGPATFHNLLLVLAGLLVYTTVNSGLIAGVIAIRRAPGEPVGRVRLVGRQRPGGRDARPRWLRGGGHPDQPVADRFRAAAGAGVAPRRTGPPAAGRGRHRSQDRAAHRGRLALASRTGDAGRRIGTVPLRAAVRSGLLQDGQRHARSSRRRPGPLRGRGGAPARGPRRRPGGPGSGARSSSCCWPTTRGMPPASWKRRPTGSAAGSPHCSWRSPPRTGRSPSAG